MQQNSSALRAGDFNVDSVREKVQEELMSVEEYIILDSGNREIVDSLSKYHFKTETYHWQPGLSKMIVCQFTF